MSNVRSCSLCAVVRPERHWKLTQCLSSCRATRSPLPGVQGALRARLFASTSSKWRSRPGSETRFEFVAPRLWRRICGAKPCGATNSAPRTQRVSQTGGHSQPYSVKMGRDTPPQSLTRIVQARWSCFDRRSLGWRSGHRQQPHLQRERGKNWSSMCAYFVPTVCHDSCPLGAHRQSQLFFSGSFTIMAP